MSPDRWPFRVFLVLLFWLPIPLGSNRDWAWLLAAAIVLVLAAWMGLLMSRDRVAPSAALLAAKWPLLALAGWLLWGCLQWLPLPVGLTAWLSPASAWPQPVELVAGWSSLSVDPFRSFLTWLQSLSLALIFVLALQCANRPRRVRRLVGVLILAGVIQAVYGGFMTLSGIEWSLVSPKEYNRGLATGTFVNRNHLAGFLVLCTTIGIGYLLGQMRESMGKREWRQKMRDWARLVLGPKMRLRVYLSLMVIALVLTHSRMGNASLFSAMMIAGVLGLFLLRRAPRAMLTLVVSLLIIDIVIVGTWFGVEQVVDRIQTTGTWSEQGQRYRDQDRLDVDNEVLGAWQSFRLLGSGGGTFYTVFPAYRQSDISHYFDHAHNDYLEFLLEYGVLGGLFIAGFWAMSAAAAVNAQRVRRDPAMRGLAFGAGMASLAVAIHASVDFNLHIPANASYFMVILALGIIAAHLPTRKRAVGYAGKDRNRLSQQGGLGA